MVSFKHFLGVSPSFGNVADLAGRAQAGARRAQSDAVPRVPGAGRGRGEGLHPAAGLHHPTGKFINEMSHVNKIFG